MIEIKQEGRRCYLIGDTYAIKDRIRDAGGRWDPGKKAWWFGDHAKAEIFTNVATAPAASATTPGSSAGTLGEDDRIQGKAKYKNKTYILVWLGQTKRGRAAKLAFSDGSKMFWADESQIEITKAYTPREYRGHMEHMTFGKLKSLQEDWKRKTPEQREEEKAVQEAGGRCRCTSPIDEGDGTCMSCGYYICE